MLERDYAFAQVHQAMKIVADVVRQFSVRLMLVAIMALALQASGASAYANGETGDCPNDAHLARSTDRAGDAPSFKQTGVAHAPKALCTSTCCNAACSMAAIVLPVTVAPPESSSGTRHASVFNGVEGTDLDDLLRPRERRLPSGMAAAHRAPRPGVFVSSFAINRNELRVGERLSTDPNNLISTSTNPGELR